MRLCTGRTARKGSRGITLFFHDHGTRWGCGVSVTPRPLFTSGKEPVPTVQEAGWAPAPVWTGAENLALTGIRSPDRPARSQSLYRQSYRGPHSFCGYRLFPNTFNIVVCFLVGNSPASEFYMPTFRNTLSVPCSWTGRYEDGTECSKTSAYKIQTPGNYPEESIQHSEHDESLK